MKVNATSSAQSTRGDEREVEFLSRGIEFLIDRQGKRCSQALDDPGFEPEESDVLDVVIVGSGYGGAIAASELSKFGPVDGVPTRVCVLERGRERLPGSFPERLSDMPGEVRVHRSAARTTYGNRGGLFDVRLGEGCSVLVANGLGGGSLINAGVMLAPTRKVMNNEMWPDQIRRDTALDALFEEASVMLGSTLVLDGHAVANTVSRAGCEPRKFQALQSLGGEDLCAEAVPITVALDDTGTQDVKTDVCIGCGDCFSGCNHNAKKSLDTNLLAAAQRRGVEIYCGATVTAFERRDAGLWMLSITHTDKAMRKHLEGRFPLFCRTLILAAGTLGSTELLLRSERQSQGRLMFSTRLGYRFSGNGDMLAMLSDRSKPTHSTSNSTEAPCERRVGPTITGMLDGRERKGAVIQELAVPGALREFLAESAALTRTIGALTRIDRARARDSESFLTLLPGTVGSPLSAGIGTVADSNESATAAIEHFSVLAAMGDDGVDGLLSLPDGAAEEGSIRIEFNGHAETTLDRAHGTAPGNNSFYERTMQFIRELSARNDPNAWVHANPLWKPFGKDLEGLFDAGVNGMQLTVHPLGGCVMGENVSAGVVNAIGQVFRRHALATDSLTDLHDDLIVLDGSIIPVPLGINPALTISTLALRASRELARSWGWKLRRDISKSVSSPRRRPRFADPVPHEPRPRGPTMVELNERLVGPLDIDTGSGVEPFVVELTLRSRPWDISSACRFEDREVRLLDADLSAMDSIGKLPERSCLRVYRKDAWRRMHDLVAMLDDWEKTDRKTVGMLIRQTHSMSDKDVDQLQSAAVFVAPLTGAVRLFEEVPTPFAWRFARGVWAWFLNRGYRDAWQSYAAQIGERISGPRWWSRYFTGEAMAVFAHTGRERRIGYRLQIGVPSKSTLVFGNGSWEGKEIVGAKSFTYRRRSNPWEQLLSVRLSDFPDAQLSEKKVLTVDAEHFGRCEAPLIHIVDEEDAITGYADLFAFYFHTARVTLLHHLWSLRKPDDRLDRRASPAIARDLRPPPSNALPGSIPGLHRMRYELELPSRLSDNDRGTVRIILTRYRSAPVSRGVPVVCIHGYSASGTTFAHPSVYGGKDRKGGLARYLCEAGRDVWVLDMRSSCGLETASVPWDFEHMADLDIPAAIKEVCRITAQQQVDVVAHCMGAVMLSMSMLGQPVPQLGGSVHQRIRRIVLSQAGPFLKFTPANTFRAYLLSYFRQALTDIDYSFFPKDVLSDNEVLLDRLLATLPYPGRGEWDRENPVRGNRRWVRARHRMDALYGRTFNIEHMSDDVLDRMDEFFGVIHFRTLQQALPIADRRQLSDRYGQSYKVDKADIRDRWVCPTLWIHSTDNGLVDPVSPILTLLQFKRSGNDNLRCEPLKGRGHQDSLIGSDCKDAFLMIKQHLSEDIETSDE